MLIYSHEWRAERSGEKIELSPREVAILELLHERGGDVVNRNFLLDQCSGIDYLP